MIYQEVYLLENLTIEAKGIYGVLCSFAKAKPMIYPSADYLCKILQVSKRRLLKHMYLLIEAGIVEKKRIKDKFGRPANNVYILASNIQAGNSQIGTNQISSDQIGNSQIGYVQEEIINDNTLSNVNKKNKENINYQEIVNLYNDICISFPKVTVLSEVRKKAIKARLRIYSLKDFKKLFEMAENSRFLKGCNDRNWSANFDWLIKDSNMVKVLEGNYEDKLDNRPRQTSTGNIFLDMLQEEEEKERDEQNRDN